MRGEKLFKIFGNSLIEIKKMTSEEVFEKTGYKNCATLNSMLSFMVKEGEAVKISMGVYKLVVKEYVEEIDVPKDDSRSVEELSNFISIAEKECLNLEKDEERLLKKIEELQNQIKEKVKEKKEKEKDVLIAKKLIEKRQSKIKEAAGLLKVFFGEKGIKTESILENPDILL